MTIPKWLNGLTSACLIACAGCHLQTRPVLVAPPRADALTAPTEIEGPVRTRADAADNGELWNFAGQAEAATLRCNVDKAELRGLLAPPGVAPPCPWWRFGRC